MYTEQNRHLNGHSVKILTYLSVLLIWLSWQTRFHTVNVHTRLVQTNYISIILGVNFVYVWVFIWRMVCSRVKVFFVLSFFFDVTFLYIYRSKSLIKLRPLDKQFFTTEQRTNVPLLDILHYIFARSKKKFILVFCDVMRFISSLTAELFKYTDGSTWLEIGSKRDLVSLKRLALTKLTISHSSCTASGSQ